MNKMLAIMGAGGHGKVVADAALSNGEWPEIVFFDDAYPDIVSNSQGIIVGTGADLHNTYNKFAGVIVAIGENRVRLAKTLELQRKGAKIVSVIHPQAVVSPNVSIGPGSVVFAGAILNVDAKIGQACIVNTGSIIEHDCQLHDGVHLCPNATLAGCTEIGECSWIGIGAVTRQSINIGSDVVVGAGSVVINAIQDKVTVAGNPATILS